MTAAETMLPPLYARWLEELGCGPLPEEREATCSDCAMCSDDPHAVGEFFDPHTKCCTYVPELFNFLVGRVLADESADPVARRGRKSVVKRIRDADGVTPLGLGRPRAHLSLYRQSSDAFGHAQSMRCPHYVDEAGGR